MSRLALRSSGLLIAALLMAAPASAQAVQSVQVGVGAFFPRGFDARVDGDTLVADLDNANPLLFNISDFKSAHVYGEWNVTFGDRVEVGAGVGFQKRTVPSVYRDLVNEDRSEIEQDLKLRVTPITGIVRFLPFGRASSVQPYIGAGVGVFNFRYSEVGQFVDTSDFSVFTARFVATGNAVGGLFVYGLRIPVGGDIYGFVIEGRHTFAQGDTNSDFLGDKIDLGGSQLNFAVLVRF